MNCCDPLPGRNWVTAYLLPLSAVTPGMSLDFWDCFLFARYHRPKRLISLPLPIPVQPIMFLPNVLKKNYFTSVSTCMCSWKNALFLDFWGTNRFVRSVAVWFRVLNFLNLKATILAFNRKSVFWNVFNFCTVGYQERKSSSNPTVGSIGLPWTYQ